jgi:hypothetical protein
MPRVFIYFDRIIKLILKSYFFYLQVHFCHGDLIVLPYAISDTYSNFATIKISALLQTMMELS